MLSQQCKCAFAFGALATTHFSNDITQGCLHINLRVQFFSQTIMHVFLFLLEWQQMKENLLQRRKTDPSCTSFFIINQI
jgi:hypothetical protein